MPTYNTDSDWTDEHVLADDPAELYRLDSTLTPKPVLSVKVAVACNVVCNEIEELTADVARTLISRRALGRAWQKRLNIMGSAVGSAEWGSRPAVINMVTCG